MDRYQGAVGQRHATGEVDRKDHACGNGGEPDEHPKRSDGIGLHELFLLESFAAPLERTAMRGGAVYQTVDPSRGIGVGETPPDPDQPGGTGLERTIPMRGREERRRSASAVRAASPATSRRKALAEPGPPEDKPEMDEEPDGAGAGRSVETAGAAGKACSSKRGSDQRAGRTIEEMSLEGEGAEVAADLTAEG